MHLCIDMQNVFAEDTEWRTPWMPRVLPRVVQLVAFRPERTVFTRFLPPVSADDARGMWRHYFKRWEAMTRERLAPRMMSLVPELAAFVPPARVLDKPGYSAWHQTSLAQALNHRRITTVVVSGAETDVCVLSTVLGAVERGFRVIVASDALCSSSDQMHDALLGLYANRFSEQIETAEVAEIVEGWDAVA